MRFTSKGFQRSLLSFLNVGPGLFSASRPPSMTSKSLRDDVVADDLFLIFTKDLVHLCKLSANRQGVFQVTTAYNWNAWKIGFS